MTLMYIPSLCHEDFNVKIYMGVRFDDQKCYFNQANFRQFMIYMIMAST